MSSFVPKNIGWIGTGVMGGNLVRHMLKKGHHMKIFDRNPKNYAPLVDQGAQLMEPHLMAREVDYLFMMVGHPHDVENLVLKAGDKSLMQNLRPGAFLVDHTTSSPTLAKTLYDEASSKGIISVDAPVTGGDQGAINGTLAVMTGGDRDAAMEVGEIIDPYTNRMEYFGKAGAGQHAKLLN